MSNRLQLIFSARHRWLATLAALLLAVLLGVIGGWVVATAGALITAALVVGLAAGLWVLRDIEAGYWAVFGVVCLLPFGALPVSISPRPTFLDLAIGALFGVWLLHIATGYQRDLIATPLGLPILGFLLVSVLTFIAGLGHAALDKNTLRHFVEVLISILGFFLVVNTVRDQARLERLTRALILAGLAAALLAAVLYVLPEETQIALLSRLRVFNYGQGPGVLRYIESNPELPLRATGTSVDPNTLGGLLIIILGLATPQLFARRPLVPRWAIALTLGVMGLALVLTFSRGSLMGIAVALLALAVLRYRKLLPVLAAAAAMGLLLPWTQAYVIHLIEGFQLQDLATQMRLGEYKDALILIQRYPLLGVGFVGSPDIDTYLGVANVYLTIAGQMGLLGLGSFLLVVGVLFASAARVRHSVPADERLEPAWWGYHAAILATLAGGFFDHYFFNLDFHHSITLFWIVVGLAAVCSRLATSQGERNTLGTPLSL